jgi:hypothetical protein
MNKARLWRVDISHMLGYQAPSFLIETETKGNELREKAEQEAIRLARGKSGLGRFPKIWKFTVTHLEGHFQIDGRWVKQGVYRLNERGQWVKNR